MKLSLSAFTAKKQTGKLKDPRFSNLNISCLLVSIYFSKRESLIKLVKINTQPKWYIEE